MNIMIPLLILSMSIILLLYLVRIHGYIKMFKNCALSLNGGSEG
jgi:hypothetical protein